MHAFTAIFIAAAIVILNIAIATTKEFEYPKGCRYFLDDRGRNKVVCDKGGIEGSLDVTKVDVRTEVLEITAPEDNLNSLMIGPIFGAFTKMEEIHLTRSNIPEIGKHSFWRLPTLEVLNLRENNITTILDHNFRGLPSLKQLYLDENRIDRLSSGTFRYLVSLTVLSLARNRIDELVTRVFEKLTKLQVLKLNENPIHHLNAEIFNDINELQVLECRSCGLKDISTDIYHIIPHLTTLDLGNNMLSNLPADHFNDVTNLQSLWLDGNGIESLPDSMFAFQFKLKKLNIARNRLGRLPTHLFENVTDLRELDVSYNDLVQVQTRTFQPFSTNLKSLALSGNRRLRATDFKYILQLCQHIIHLRLADMDLADVPLGLFDFNAELLSLDMSANRFVHLPVGALAPLAQLNELNLSKNWLRGLDEKALLRLDSIDLVHLGQNKWACDLCHIVPILERMNRSLYLQELKCQTPSYLRHRKFANIKVYDLKRCTSNELLYEDGDGDGLAMVEGQLGVIAAGAGLLLLILTLVALLAGVVYSRRHAANYYTHEDKRPMEHDPMFDNTDILFADNGELSFKFQADTTKISISTIDEIKKDPDIQIKR